MAGSYYSYKLLENSKISGGEFVTLTIAVLFLGVIIALLPKISELSIAGNVLKLQNAKDVADKTIQSLQKTQNSTLRINLLLVKNSPGGLGDLFRGVDPRVDDFWLIYNAIKEAGAFETLKSEINEISKLLCVEQLKIIGKHNTEVRDQYNNLSDQDFSLPPYIDVMRLLLNKNQENQHKELSNKTIVDASNEYRKLFEIYNKSKA